jgi:hypothetical protein
MQSTLSRFPFALAVTGLLASGATAFSQDGGKTTRQVMLDMVVPASDAVFAVAEPLKNAAEWATLQGQLKTLTDAGALLTADRVRRNDGSWRQELTPYRDAVAAAAKAAAGKDFDAFTAASDKLAETCINCHARYLPK